MAPHHGSSPVRRSVRSRIRPLLIAATLPLVLLLGVATVPGSASAAPPTSGSTASGSTASAATREAPRSAASRYAAQAFGATNRERTRRGRVRLQRDACLQRFANRQARRLASTRDHSLPHQPLGPIMRRCRLSTAGENLAYGLVDGRAVVRAWMGSSGHRANILHRPYRVMAIAARRASDGQWYAAQVFGRHR